MHQFPLAKAALLAVPDLLPMGLNLVLLSALSVLLENILRAIRAQRALIVRLENTLQLLRVHARSVLRDVTRGAKQKVAAWVVNIQRLLRAMRLPTARTASLTSFTILTATRSMIAVLGVAVAVVMASIAQIAQVILHCKA